MPRGREPAAGRRQRELGRRRRDLEARAARGAFGRPERVRDGGDVLADGARRHRRSRREPGDRRRAAVGDADGPRDASSASRRRPRRGCFIAWRRSTPPARRWSASRAPGAAAERAALARPGTGAKLEAINQQFDAHRRRDAGPGSEAADRARRSGRAHRRPAGRRRPQHARASRSRACRRSGSRRSRSRWRSGSARRGRCPRRSDLARCARAAAKDPGSGGAVQLRARARNSGCTASAATDATTAAIPEKTWS